MIKFKTTVISKKLDLVSNITCSLRPDRLTQLAEELVSILKVRGRLYKKVIKVNYD